MTEALGGVNNTNPILSAEVINSNQNVGFLFALLQMELASANKTQAVNKISDIRANQDLSKEYTTVINALRSAAGTLNTDDTKTKLNTHNAINNLTASERNILNTITGGDKTTGEVSRAQINTWIASLESEQETIGSDVQQQMVYVQDFMGQYNSYTQGCMSAITSINETLKTVARGS